MVWKHAHLDQTLTSKIRAENIMRCILLRRTVWQTQKRTFILMAPVSPCAETSSWGNINGVWQLGHDHEFTTLSEEIHFVCQRCTSQSGAFRSGLSFVCGHGRLRVMALTTRSAVLRTLISTSYYSFVSNSQKQLAEETNMELGAKSALHWARRWRRRVLKNWSDRNTSYRSSCTILDLNFDDWNTRIKSTLIQESSIF